MDPGAIVVTELISEEQVADAYFDLNRGAGGRRHVTTGGGCLGWGVPNAIGAKIAQPDRQVVALVGDGSFQFGVQALWTAVRYEIPVAVVIWNNGAYQANRKFLHQYGGRAAATGRYPGCALDHPAIDHAAISQGVRRRGRARRGSGEAERGAGALLQDDGRRPSVRRRRHDRAALRRRRLHLVRLLLHRARHREADLIMQRRTFLTTGSMAAIGFGVVGVQHESEAGRRRATAAGQPRAGQGVVGSRDPHDRRPAPASRRRLRPEARQARRQAARAQLRARRRRDVAGVGHRADGGGVRDRAPVAAGGGDRLRIGRAHVRAAAAAPRLRRHDLRAGGAAQRHVEHVARRLHAGVRPRGRRQADAGVGRAVPPRRGHLVPAAATARRAALRRVVARQLLAGRTSCVRRTPARRSARA